MTRLSYDAINCYKLFNNTLYLSLRFKFHAELHVSLYNRFLQQNEVRKNKAHIVLMKWLKTIPDNFYSRL